MTTRFRRYQVPLSRPILWLLVGLLGVLGVMVQVAGISHSTLLGSATGGALIAASIVGALQVASEPIINSKTGTLRSKYRNHSIAEEKIRRPAEVTDGALLDRFSWRTACSIIISTGISLSVFASSTKNGYIPLVAGIIISLVGLALTIYLTQHYFIGSYDPNWIDRRIAWSPLWWAILLVPALPAVIIDLILQPSPTVSITTLGFVLTTTTVFLLLSMMRARCRDIIEAERQGFDYYLDFTEPTIVRPFADARLWVRVYSIGITTLTCLAIAANALGAIIPVSLVVNTGALLALCDGLIMAYAMAISFS